MKFWRTVYARLILATLTSLAFALTGCPEDDNNGSEQDTGGLADAQMDADTGVDASNDDDADAQMREADCTVDSVLPRTTSWSGGGEIVVTLECEDAGVLQQIDLTLAAAELDASVDERVAVDAETLSGEVTALDASTAQATFIAPEQPGTGARTFGLDVNGSDIGGGEIRFRRDPAGLGALSNAPQSRELIAWGLPAAHIESCSAKDANDTPYKKTRVVSPLKVGDGPDPTGQFNYGHLRDGEIQAAAATAVDCPCVDFAIASDNFCPKLGQADGSSPTTATVVVTVHETNDARYTLDVTTFADDGTSVTAEKVPAQEDTLPEMLTDIDSDDPQLAAYPTFDDAGGLKSIEVTLVTERNGTPGLRLLNGTVTGGSLKWSIAWSLDMPGEPLHVSAPLRRTDGTRVLAVFTKDGANVPVTLYSASSADIAAEAMWPGLADVEELTTSVVDLDDDGADELIVAATNPQGEVHMGQWNSKAGSSLTTAVLDQAPLPQESEVALRVGSAGDVHLITEAKRHPRPPLELQTGTIPIHIPMNMTTTWTPGAGTVDVTTAPDRSELVTTSGAAVGGDPNGKLGGPLEVFYAAPDLTEDPPSGPFVAVTFDPNDTAPRGLTLAARGGWRVFTEGGDVYAQRPDGTDRTSPLPAVALPPGRVSSTNLDGSSPATTNGAQELATLEGDSVRPDLFITLPDDTAQSGCPFATWFIPGTGDQLEANFAERVRVATSADSDCTDLAVPVASGDLQDVGQNTVILTKAAGDDPEEPSVVALISITYADAGQQLVQMPTIEVPAVNQVRTGDLDGDGFQDLFLGFGQVAADDGAVDPTLSALVLRSQGGSWYGDVAGAVASPDTNIGVTRTAAASAAGPLTDKTGLTGAAIPVGGLDAAAMTNTVSFKGDDGEVLDRLDFYITGVE